MDSWAVAIIGAGPAGVSAAIQLRRSGIEPLLYEAAEVGGLVRNAGWIENLVGFPEGIGGAALAERLAHHLEAEGVEVRAERVDAVSYEGTFTLRGIGRERCAHRLIIASGTEPRALPGVPIDDAIADRVVSEIVALRSLRGARVAILGAGDAAFDYALQLGESNQVTILHRSAHRRCLNLLWQRSRECPRIRYQDDTVVRAIGPGPDGAVRVGIDTPHGADELDVDWVVLAIGRQPRLGFLDASVASRLDEFVERGMLFLAGDVRNGSLRQVAIAAGDGLGAAMRIAQEMERDRCES
jgi:thioredoxin reductase (NADPH)